MDRVDIALKSNIEVKNSKALRIIIATITPGIIGTIIYISCIEFGPLRTIAWILLIVLLGIIWGGLSVAIYYLLKWSKKY